MDQNRSILILTWYCLNNIFHYFTHEKVPRHPKKISRLSGACEVVVYTYGNVLLTTSLNNVLLCTQSYMYCNMLVRKFSAKNSTFFKVTPKTVKFKFKVQKIGIMQNVLKNSPINVKFWRFSYLGYGIKAILQRIIIRYQLQWNLFNQITYEIPWHTYTSWGGIINSKAVFLSLKTTQVDLPVGGLIRGVWL